MCEGVKKVLQKLEGILLHLWTFKMPIFTIIKYIIIYNYI